MKYITGNTNKAREASRLLNKEVVAIDIDLPEYQGSIEFIARKKAEEALKHTNPPLLVEDIGLYFDELGGLPGPYIKWFLNSMSTTKLASLACPNTNAKAVCAVAYVNSEDGVEVVKVISRECHGHVVSPRGNNGFGWDTIFMPDGYSQTYAEMSNELKNEISPRSVIGLLK